MKRLFVLLMSIMLILGVNSCRCTSDQKEVTPVVDSLAVTELVVENTISADKESVYLNHGKDYRWYETGVVLTDWLDGESDGSIEMVVNVFQVVDYIDSTSFDTYVYKYQHTQEGTVEDSVHGFWVEDSPLNDEKVTVTFKDAFERVQSVNYPKPHSRQVVLRKEVGPVDVNPQWIFGNSSAQLYVDAVTGEVRDWNPAFPKDTQLNYAFSW